MGPDLTPPGDGGSGAAADADTVGAHCSTWEEGLPLWALACLTQASKGALFTSCPRQIRDGSVIKFGCRGQRSKVKDRARCKGGRYYQGPPKHERCGFTPPAAAKRGTGDSILVVSSASEGGALHHIPRCCLHADSQMRSETLPGPRSRSAQRSRRGWKPRPGCLAAGGEFSDHAGCRSTR